MAVSGWLVLLSFLVLKSPGVLCILWCCVGDGRWLVG